MAATPKLGRPTDTEILAAINEIDKEIRGDGLPRQVEEAVEALVDIHDRIDANPLAARKIVGMCYDPETKCLEAIDDGGQLWFRPAEPTGGQIRDWQRDGAPVPLHDVPTPKLDAAVAKARAWAKQFFGPQTLNATRNWLVDQNGIRAILEAAGLTE